jgi:hypothetical protein
VAAAQLRRLLPHSDPKSVTNAREPTMAAKKKAAKKATKKAAKKKTAKKAGKKK